MKRRAGIVLGAAIVGAALLPTAAVAAPAGSSSFAIPSTFVMGSERSGCAFDITVSGVDQVQLQTTYDKSGVATKAVQRIDYSGTQTAKGTTLEVSEHSITTTDLVAGTSVIVGQQLRISLPSGGPVVLNVGRIVTDAHGDPVVEHGWHTSTADNSRYCAAFGS